MKSNNHKKVASIFAANPEKASRNEKKEEHIYRDKFERDRDRILYSKAFMRLSGKTQVFTSGSSDHIRTRLTHTLEVSQIARTISKKLGLNLELTEAIALGHDIGHTPFGHIGERTLNYIMNGCDELKVFNLSLPDNEKGFKHNWQGIRVLSKIEKSLEGIDGLNLTDYTLWGILHHTKIEWEKECEKRQKDNSCSLRHKENKKCNNRNGNLKINFYKDGNIEYINEAWSLEGLVIYWADEIAQRHHDIQDGIEAGLVDKQELIAEFERIFRKFLSDKHKEEIKILAKEKNKNYFFPRLSSFIIDFFVTKLIEDTEKNLEDLKKHYSIKSKQDFYTYKPGIIKELLEKNTVFNKVISYEKSFIKVQEYAQKYLKDRILNSHMAQSMDGKANYIIRQLFKAYLTNPQQLSDEAIINFYKIYNKELFDKYFKDDKLSTPTKIGNLRGQLGKDHDNIEDKYRFCLLRTVCDYISGMTDQYALNQYETLYGTKTYEIV